MTYNINEEQNIICVDAWYQAPLGGYQCQFELCIVVDE